MYESSSSLSAFFLSTTLIGGYWYLTDVCIDICLMVMMLSVFHAFTSAIPLSPLGKILFKSFAHFLMGCLLLLSFDLLKNISWTHDLCQKCDVQTFSPHVQLVWSIGERLKQAYVCWNFEISALLPSVCDLVNTFFYTPESHANPKSQPPKTT